MNSEIEVSLNHFRESWPDFELKGLSLFGINGAHPVLVDLLQERLGVPVESRCPSLFSSLSSLQFDEKLLVVRGLSRLIGLGCGILSTGMNEMRDAQSVVVRKKSNNQLPRLDQESDVDTMLIDEINPEISSLLVQNIPVIDEFNVLSDVDPEESSNLSSERVVKVEVKELKEEENVGEEESLEEEWPSLSLDLTSEEKELNNQSKKDLRATANLEEETTTKRENLDLENDTLHESSSLLGELRFSDE